MNETLYESRESMPWYQSNDLDQDAADAEWARGEQFADAMSAAYECGYDEDEARVYAQRQVAPQAIETRFLLVPGDTASLRDFLRRAEADLANPQGTRATWPELAADVERAVALARARLAEGDR